jgi:hypothetical protein
MVHQAQRISKHINLIYPVIYQAIYHSNKGKIHEKKEQTSKGARYQKNTTKFEERKSKEKNKALTLLPPSSIFDPPHCTVPTSLAFLPFKTKG